VARAPACLCGRCVLVVEVEVVGVGVGAVVVEVDAGFYVAVEEVVGAVRPCSCPDLEPVVEFEAVESGSWQAVRNLFDTRRTQVYALKA
jgi:hypothetical protein